jgi:ferredoxin-thioredoxin reductase catalytic subunit
MPIPAPEDRPKVEERLRNATRRWCEITGYHLNPEEAVVEGIVQALVRSTMTYGYPYCPCRDLTGDHAVDKVNVCPCKFHRDEIAQDGHCKCVLYVGDQYDPVETYRPKGGSIKMDTARSVRERIIQVYGTSWCYHSRRTRNFLHDRNVPFEDIDIERDAEAAKRVEGWNRGYRSVPTIVARLILTEPSTQELASILTPPGVTRMAITIYITQWCSQSRRTVNWLRDNAVAAEIVDIERDRAAAQRVMEWNRGNQSVPTVDVTLRATEPSIESLERMLGLSVAWV